MIRPKKHLGQHFLSNITIASNITKLVSPHTKNLLEIGPGMGMLTQLLINNSYKIYVVEIDPESVRYLKSKFLNLTIFEGDFLKIKIKKEYPFNFTLIGNFPYNISNQILFKIYLL